MSGSCEDVVECFIKASVIHPSLRTTPNSDQFKANNNNSVIT